MMTINIQRVGDKALVPQQDFDRLVELARQREEIAVRTEDIPSSPDMMRLAEEGGAFDFWKEEGENIYTAEDGEAV